MASKRKLRHNPWRGERTWRYWPGPLAEKPATRDVGARKSVRQVVAEIRKERESRKAAPGWKLGIA